MHTVPAFRVVLFWTTLRIYLPPRYLPRRNGAKPPTLREHLRDLVFPLAPLAGGETSVDVVIRCDFASTLRAPGFIPSGAALVSSAC